MHSALIAIRLRDLLGVDPEANASRALIAIRLCELLGVDPEANASGEGLRRFSHDRAGCRKPSSGYLRRRAETAARRYPTGTRLIVRRERPHPGAQLTITDIDGWRFQAFATDTPTGQLSHLEARHRAHARVEGRICCGKDHRDRPVPSADTFGEIGDVSSVA